METQNPLQNWADASVENLIRARSATNDLKVEIWEGTIRERLNILGRALEQLTEEELALDNLVLSAQAMQDQPREQFLQQQVLGIPARKMVEEKECWKDIVMVLRDFVGAVEAQRQSKARGEFLNAPRGPTQTHLQ